MTHWLVFVGEKLVVRKDKMILSEQDLEHLKSSVMRAHPVALKSDVLVNAAEFDASVELPVDFDVMTFRKALELLGDEWFAFAAKAYSILRWDRMHAFCGVCGSRTEKIADKFERFCHQCDQIFYPRISPSIIVLVKRGDEILMARSPHFPEGVFGLIAGFVEPGETLEEAVHREVFEEVRIKVKNLKYFDSQSWPFPDSLMIGFFAEYESGDIEPDLTEIETSGWFTKDSLPGRPSTNLSIASRMLDVGLAG